MGRRSLTIAAVVNDLSGNCLVRSYPILKVLERAHRIEVIGIAGREGVFAPFRDELTYRPFVPGRSRVSQAKALLDVAAAIDADVVYAFKPVLASYGMALLSRLRRRRPIVLDIEDWDNEAFERLSLPGKVGHALRHLAGPNGFYDWVVDSLHGLADAKTVGSSFLLARYGGVKLPHGADAQVFDPKRYDRAEAREALGLAGRRVILFAGTVRGHKGVLELLDAMRAVDRPDLVLAIAGTRTPELDALLARGEARVRVLGPQPHARMPAVWLAADLVVLPQKDTPFARAQIPGKVFEAMAMARPIIATAVSDLPEILEGCGWLVPPDDPGALAEAIERACADPAAATELGERARARFLARYCWDVMEGILDGVFAPYE